MSRTVFITGFGRFHGVEDNPSASIVQAIADQGIDGIPIGPIFVIQTDVPHCDKYFSELKLSEEDCCVFIHIGVNAGAECINLEKFAYNNMTFRVPDESGYQPNRECIDKSRPVEEALCTDLDVDLLVDKMRQKGLPFAVSNDPGRFICNYVYYSSLHFCELARKPKRSLFVHIPPFEKIDSATQLHAIKTLIAEICESAF